jgi:hypothetical protein
MAILEIARIQVRRGEELITGIPQLAPGEFGWAEDTENLYIGKRISEGASNDNNTRVLTTKDFDTLESNLGAVFRSFLQDKGNFDATTSTYIYRSDVNQSLVSGGYINSTASTIAIKLDNFVSLTDYGISISATPTDITNELRAAVEDLYRNGPWDSVTRRDARRTLLIPAGNYYISDTIELPPYTSLRGEGQEITVLTLENTSGNMFKTVDAFGTPFEEGMLDGVNRCRSISISDITLQYSSNIYDDTTPALLSIDNALDATLEDVYFKTAYNPASTSTFGLVAGGIGISIRGTGGGIASGDANLCENIQINRCKFDSLYTGIMCTGTVVRPVLTNSILSNLDRGIVLDTIDNLVGPTNGIIASNRFSSIVREAIFVGTTTNRTSHLSENNFFVQVGNGSDLDDYTTIESTCTSVIAFHSTGNKSTNDYFHRRSIAESVSISDPFFYYPIVTGRTAVDDSATIVATIPTASDEGSGIANLFKLPVTGNDQLVTLRYQMSNNFLTRGGEVTINVAPDGFSSLNDSYTFSSSNEIVRENISPVVAPGYFATQFVVDLDIYPEFIDVIGQTPFPGVPTATDGSWFIVDTANNNNSALLTAFNTSSGSLAVFETQSGPVITFNTGTNVYTLARSISTPITIDVNTSLIETNNYIVITAENNSTSTGTLSTIEFSVNILQ